MQRDKHIYFAKYRDDVQKKQILFKGNHGCICVFTSICPLAFFHHVDTFAFVSILALVASVKYSPDILF